MFLSWVAPGWWRGSLPLLSSSSMWCSSSACGEYTARTCYLYLFCPSSLPSLFSLKGSKRNILKNITCREGNQLAFCFFFTRENSSYVFLLKKPVFSILNVERWPLLLWEKYFEATNSFSRKIFFNCQSWSKHMVYQWLLVDYVPRPPPKCPAVSNSVQRLTSLARSN